MAVGAAQAGEASAAGAAGAWTNAWSAPQSDAFASIVLNNQTLRQVLTVLYPGDKLRVRFSNRYGRVPVTLDAVHIGLAEGEAGLAPGSGHALRFDGQTRVTLAPGASIWSEPVALKVSSMQRLAMSLHAAGRFTNLSRHANGVEYIWRAPGDHAADEGGQAFTRVEASSWVLADAVDVQGPPPDRVVVVLGDSVAEGFVTALVVPPPADFPPVTLDAAHPDLLAARLLAGRQSIAVVNAAIAGNRLLSPAWVPTLGPSGLSRLQRDVSDVAGVTDVVVMIGINDLALARIPNPQALIEGFRALTAQMRAAGVRVHLGTLPPAKGGGFFGSLLHGRESVTQARAVVNSWIRQASDADKVIDFDACLRDPVAPDYLLLAYDSGDHLHLSPAGHEAMARCINLSAAR